MLITEGPRKSKLLRGQRGRGVFPLEVAEEPGRTSAFPVMLVVFRGPRAVAQGAEERVVRGADDDTDVSRPNHQIPGLRMLYAQKMIRSAVQVGGVRVGVGITCAFVNRMYEVRAVHPMPAQVAIECGVNDGGTLISR